MTSTAQDLNEEHIYGEYEIRDHDDDRHSRGRGQAARSRSIGNRRGVSRHASGDSVCSNRSKSKNRSRSSSAGRLSHRQRSRAMMASPSKYGRAGMRRADRESDLDVSKRSTATTVVDDLSDESSPSLPEGDDDSNHQLRRRVSLMTEMASSASPSAYRQRKKALQQRLSNENMMDSISNLAISPTDSSSTGVKSHKHEAADTMPKASSLDQDSSEFSVHSASIERQQKREQAALEEVMSMVAKTKSSRRSSRLLDSSNSRSGIPSEMASHREDRNTVRRTQSLNLGARPRRRSTRAGGSMAQKKERRDMIKDNLSMFMEDD